MHDEQLAEDLKTTSYQVSATAERLDELEAEKRGLEPHDPRVVELSDQIERLAARLRRQTAIEGGLTHELRTSVTEEPA
jgi:hypothetical protein